MDTYWWKRLNNILCYVNIDHILSFMSVIKIGINQTWVNCDKTFFEASSITVSADSYLTDRNSLFRMLYFKIYKYIYYCHLHHHAIFKTIRPPLSWVDYELIARKWSCTQRLFWNKHNSFEFAQQIRLCRQMKLTFRIQKFLNLEKHTKKLDPVLQRC